MTVSRIVAAWSAIFLATAALAQGESSDVPPGPGAVVGRLVHATRPEASANVDILLYALSPDGSGGLRQTRSDAAGRFRFEGVSNAPDIAYLVGARADEIPFGSRFNFAPGELEHEVELVLQDPIAEVGAIAAGGVDVRIERGCTHLRVSHSHTLTNPGDQVVFVPVAARDTADPIFEAVLPDGVEGFESMLGREGLERDGAQVRFWGPLYPGTQQVEYGYGLPLATERFAIGLPGGAPEVSVLAPEGVLRVASDALAPAPTVTVAGQPYTVQHGDALAPGATLPLDVTLAERPPSPIATPRAELWLELDDVALEVNERIELVSEQPVGESLGEPLLCMPIPTGALELRFSSAMMEAGLRRDPSGDLAIHGPLPAGPTQLAIRYRLPATGAGADLTRRYDREVPLLSVLVADNGVVAETKRLHRRRAVRSADRMYLHLEAFAVEPLEPIELGLRRTPPRDAGGGFATASFAVLAGLAALGFLAAPLRGDADEPRATDERDADEIEREVFARALEDLDDDLATGKLSPEDHAAMRAELRTRAAAQLLQKPAATPEPESSAASEDAAPVCTTCGAPPAPEARFCSQCGAALRCASCDHPIAAGAASCSKCGATHGAGASQA